MTEPSPIPQAPHAAPRPLWRAMRGFLCLLFDLFGEPGDIAARGWLGRKDRALITPWLRAGEAFLRRLLFIEALALTVETDAPTRVRAARQRLRKLYEFHAGDPDAWRVSFRLLPSSRRTRRAAPCQTPRSSGDNGSAWPVAERFEAMLRAYNDPQPAARRLARLLHRKPHRALQALRPEPAQIANLFGAVRFARCNAIVASRRRRCERPAHADSS